MRHRKVGRKLGRTASHRKALLRALSTSLLRNKKIRTTVAKAKETRRIVEQLLTRAKRAVARASNGQGSDIHARREVSRWIKDREVVKSLFTEIAPKLMDRPGGYTRVVKLGQRYGDAAELAVLELVDFSGSAAASSTSREAKSGKEKRKEKSQDKKQTKEVKPTAAGSKAKES